MVIIFLATILIVTGYASLLVKLYNASIKDVIGFVIAVSISLLIGLLLAFLATL